MDFLRCTEQLSNSPADPNCSSAISFTNMQKPETSNVFASSSPKKRKLSRKCTPYPERKRPLCANSVETANSKNNVVPRKRLDFTNTCTPATSRQTLSPSGFEMLPLKLPGTKGALVSSTNSLQHLRRSARCVRFEEESPTRPPYTSRDAQKEEFTIRPQACLDSGLDVYEQDEKEVVGSLDTDNLYVLDPVDWICLYA